jgi:hypothetical protein
MDVTCCFCGPDLSPAYNLTILLEDIQVLAVYTVPAMICVVLWKVFITNRITPRGGISFLGLDESSATYSPKPKPLISKWNLLLYLFTAALTFKLGLLAFETYQYLSHLWFVWFG